MTLPPADRAKSAAAAEALRLVEPGMTLGLGSGSTSAAFVRLLGEAVRGGLAVRGIATSRATADLARAEGIPLVGLDEARPDLAIDGADEVDADLTLIKGGGGAHLREKIVAAASARFVVIADASKRVDTLGAFPLPVEIVRFGAEATRARIAAVLAEAQVAARRIALRAISGDPFLTDEGHLILDLHLERIGDPRGLHDALKTLPGVVETGLFFDIADRAIFGQPDGETATVGRAHGPDSETMVAQIDLMRNLDA